MADFSNDRVEAPIAVSPALANTQTDLSKSGPNSDLDIVTKMRSAGDQVVTRVFDSSRPASVVSSQSSHTGDLRMPSSFAQRVEAGLREGDVSKALSATAESQPVIRPVAEKPTAPQTTQRAGRPGLEARQIAMVTRPSVSVSRRIIQIDYSSMPKEHISPSIKPDPTKIKPADALDLLDGIKGSRAKKERALVETKADKRILAEINAFRRENKLPPLTFDPRLKYAAGVSSDWQAENNQMTHNIRTAGWESPAQRIKNVGRKPPGGYLENAAEGLSDPFEEWKASPGHRAALLNKNANLAALSKVGKYYTFVIGRGEAVDKSKLPNST